MEERKRAYPQDILLERSQEKLKEAGASALSYEAAAKAMLHASRLGVDSHGFRLTEVYCKMMKSGQVNPSPSLKVTKTGPATAVIDADHGLGHYPSYVAVEHAAKMAAEAGVGAVGVFGSSHNGAAGTYALAGAEAGCLTLSATNADAAVMLHGSMAAFHGTNPIAASAPIAGASPWLLDMATSSIPLNRVFLYRVLGIDLPPNVAANEFGALTTDAAAAEMLLPLGGPDFGFKGAGLAGLVTILCAVLTGGTIDPDMARMSRVDTSERRNCGHFFLAVDPERFVGAAAFANAMAHYLQALRRTSAKEGETVLAPGDREWRVAAKRDAEGIPIDLDTAQFLNL